LWHEYEKAMRGRSVVRFSQGLRALLLPNEEEKTDEELAAEEVGGLEAVQFRSWFYRRLANMGLGGAVLDALDRGGFAALVELLTAWHLDELQGWEAISFENGFY